MRQSIMNTGIKLFFAPLFLNRRDRKRLHEYSQVPRAKLLEIAKLISDSLASSINDFNRFRILVESNGDLVNHVKDLQDRKMIAAVFLEYIMNQTHDSPTLEDIDKFYDDWDTEISDSIEYLVYEPISISEDQIETFAKARTTAKECRDDDYMKMIGGLLQDIQQKGQTVNPFIFLCAPSGSVKSIFAYNLAYEEYPMLYFVYFSRWVPEKTQSLYLPFQTLSLKVREFIKEDVHTLLGDNIVPNRVNVDSFALLLDVPLRTVQFIVFLFLEVIRMKQLNDKIDWMTLQLSVDRFEAGQLSINQGLLKLEVFQKAHPLVAFFDECVILRTSAEDGISEECQFVFLRSVLRYLKLIPFFAGTDAETSNFVTQEFSESRENALIVLWCKVINDLPQFADLRLKQICNDVLQNAVHPEAVTLILRFLLRASLYENPFVIQVCLDFLLRESAKESSNSVIDLLNGMLLNGFHEFVLQKKDPHHFTKGQLYYISHFAWCHNHLVVNKFNEVVINKHLAYLHSVPTNHGEPFFDLKLISSQPHYLRPGQVINSARASSEVEFLPHAIFSPFQKSPLTGLLLFGLDSKLLKTKFQPPFIMDHCGQQRSIVNLTSLDTVIEHFWHKNDMHSGQFLERVYNTAVLVASRVGGPNGCNFTSFISCLVRELYTTRDGRPYKRVQHDSFDVLADLPPVVTDERVFGDKWIPLISPMACAEWPQTLVDLLTTASQGECRLGTFHFSTGNEVVDHIIFEMNLSKSKKPVEPFEQLVQPERKIGKVAKISANGVAHLKSRKTR